MRARLATLALLGALVAPLSSAAGAPSSAPDEVAAPPATRDGEPEGALARGLVAVPAWVIHATVASVFLVAALALGRRLRSRR